MAHQLFVINNGKMYDLSELYGNLQWSGSLDELGEQLSFSLPPADNPYFPKFPIQYGDEITLYNNGKIVFLGKIIDINYSTGERSFTCFDPLFYLNKSKTTIQFKNESASNCVNKLLQPFGIPKGKIATMNTKIKKVYSDQMYSQILRDILYQAKRDIGEDYRFHMENGKLVIDRQNQFLLDVAVSLSSNSGKFDVLEFVGNPQRKVSIADMRNSVVITKDEQVYTNIADATNIKKFGLLQESIQFDGNTLSDAKKQALSALRELNRVGEEASFDLGVGHDDVKSGRVLKINEPKTGIIGQFIIKSHRHSVSNGIHKMSLTVQRY